MVVVEVMIRGVVKEDLAHLIDEGILVFNNLHTVLLGGALDDLPEVLEALGTQEVLGLQDDLALRVVDVIGRGVFDENGV
jgi:hypothetical protein